MSDPTPTPEKPRYVEILGVVVPRDNVFTISPVTTDAHSLSFAKRHSFSIRYWNCSTMSAVVASDDLEALTAARARLCALLGVEGV